MISTKTEPRRPITIFIAYAYKDRRFLDKIEQILKTLMMQNWNIAWITGEVAINMEWENRSEDYLNRVDLILLLVSPDFIATKFCYSDKLKRAIKRHKRDAYFAPIILRTCAWDGTPFAKLTPLPLDGQPVYKWPHQDEAMHNIAEGIRYALQYLHNRL